MRFREQGGAQKRVVIELLLGCCLIAIPVLSLGQGSPDIIWSQGNNSDRINAVIFSPDGNTVISGGSDRLINFWAASDGTLQKTFDSNAPAVHPSSVEGLAISPDGKTLASVNYQQLKLWRVADGKETVIDAASDWVVGCAYSPNGAFIATASFDSTVKVWRASDGALFKTLNNAGQMRAVAFSPDSSLLASGGGDNQITVRRTSDWSTVFVLKGHSDDVTSLAFSPDGSLLASGSYDQTMKVWDVRSGNLKYTEGNNHGVIYSVAFSPDGSTLAYTDGEGNTIKLVRVSDGTVTRTYDQNVNAVQTLDFSPSGLLAYGRIDRTVVLANVGGGGNTNPAPTTVTLTSPGQGATFSSPANITISANASSGTGISQVEFFVNGQSLGVDTAAPYTFAWNGVTDGTYTVSVTATGTDGSTANDSATITVGSGPPGPPDSVKPKVSITSPAANATMTTTPMTLTGRASDNVAVSQVLVSINSGPFQAADGTTSWQMSLDLNPGINTVAVKSVDPSGNESAVAKRNFTYVQTSPLTLTIAGNGRVSPNYNGKSLTVGKNYSMTASPLAAYIFSGWTGDIITNAPKLVFTMEPNTTLQANFIPNPFIPVAGVYRGLVESDPPTQAGAGYIQLTVASSGTFSAKLYWGGKIYTLSGKFNADGSYSKSIARKGLSPLNILLQLHLNDNTQQVTGTVSDGVETSDLSADLATFNARTNPAPQAGRYTFIIPPSTNAPTSPQGTGYGTAVINASGVVTYSGKLADGMAFSTSTSLSKNGTWPFFLWLNSGAETVSGQATIEDNPGSDFDGILNWFRSPLKSRLFSDGFSSQNPLVGSVFTTPPAGQPVLAFGNTTNNATVVFTGGSLDTEHDVSATLTSQNRLVSTAGTKDLNATFNRTTGLFSGTFANPTTAKQTAFSGAAIQKQNIAAGYFLGADQSGTVTVQPAQ